VAVAVFFQLAVLSWQLAVKKARQPLFLRFWDNLIRKKTDKSKQIANNISVPGVPGVFTCAGWDVGQQALPFAANCVAGTLVRLGLPTKSTITSLRGTKQSLHMLINGPVVSG
jgi:hypothetical protein